MKGATTNHIVKLPLEVKLTKDEMMAASKALAEAINKSNRIINELDTFKAQKKAELTAAKDEIAKQSVLVNSEKEFRNVECEVDYDWRKAVKHFIRLDTGEIVRTEAITNEERQQMMPGVPERKTGKDAAAGE